MKDSVRIALITLFVCLLTASAAQAQGNYNREAQEAFIPPDLGPVYIGMQFRDFAKIIDISKAESDTRFDFIALSIPFKMGAVTELSIRIHGFTEEQVAAMRTVEKLKTEAGYEREIERIDPSKIAGDGFVYAMYISFKPDFDQKSWVIETYGSDGEVRKPNDEFHFFDIQWTKKTPDGLTWLVRSFHEGDARSLQLLGRISGTEWGID